MISTALPVSVVIPAYQSAAFLRETLASVFAQTHPPREIILVDDGSTDETVAIARAAGVHVIQQENAGPSVARNRGILAATSPWIAFLDSDDLWEPHALQKLCWAVEVAGDVELAFANSITFTESGTLRGTDLERYRDYRAVRRTTIAPGIVRCEQESLIARFRRSMFILTSTVLVQREALIASGLFDPTLLIAEDWDLFLRLLRQTTAVVVEEPLVRYRVHEKNLTRDGPLNTSYEEALVERVLANPQRYPAGSAEYYRATEPRRLWQRAVVTLRAGRLGEAKVQLRERCRSHPTAASFAVYVFVVIAQTAPVQTLWRLCRALWRKRPWKYDHAGDSQ
jgi:glycosyltransferase involved in cell wall biosynthesis